MSQSPYQPQPQPQYPPPNPGLAPARKRHHIFRWFFLIVQVIFLIWIIAGAHSATSNVHCQYLNHHDCQQAADVGTSIGVAVIVFLWIGIDLVLLVGRLLVLLGRKRSA